MTAHDVQLLAAIELTRNRIVEMATGEGKTLASLFPLFFQALQGNGVLLATANDYLAERDSKFAASVFATLGIGVGVVVEGDGDKRRRYAYSMDVTYGTASQFGFDFLRDRAKTQFNILNPEQPRTVKVQRDRQFAVLVDEIDSLLIDEAATPLVISSAAPLIDSEKIAAIKLASRIASLAVEGVHYRYLKIEQKPELTSLGRQWLARQMSRLKTRNLSLVDFYEISEKAIKVERDFDVDKNYLVKNGEISLIDQTTGRVGVGRQWSEGIHQAIQAKERLPVTAPNGHLAKVTLQSFFMSFENLAGMTGTASSAAREFRRIYKLRITKIDTNRRCLRQQLPPMCFLNNREWLHAIEDECGVMIREKRAVLIGARNIRCSELISQYLTEHGIENNLLNARNDLREAEVIRLAGQPNRVTVATNMAGRGTDINLHSVVKQNGGLHVILAGIHESNRIDRQLIGRAARQGDPGSYRLIISMEDGLLDEAYSTDRALQIRGRLGYRFNESECLRLFLKAQEIISRRNEISRRVLFHQEKKQLKHLGRAGMDPLLYIPS